MPTTKSVASYDTYLAEAYPTQNFGSKTRMRLSAGTGDHRYGFLYFAGMPPHGSSVFSATLSLFLRDGSQWSGTTTITVKRVTETWSESKFTWARSGSGQGATATHAASATVTAPATTNQQVDVDVSAILSDVAAGSAWYGLRVEVDASGLHDVYTSESTFNDFRPVLTIDWSRAPDAPSDLAPSGGLAVSLQKPTLTWKFKDPDSDPQSAYQVQTCLDSTFGTVEFDTGWVTDPNSQVDLSATSYAGLSNGDTRFWRVRAQDNNGLVSPWSTVESFVRQTHGTFTIANPPNGGFVEETTPPITSTLTGRAQVGILYHLEQLESNGAWQELWFLNRFDAPEADGSAFTYNVPAGLLKKNGQTYRIRSTSYDGIDRVRTPGDPLGVEAITTFTFNRSAVPAPVTGLTVTPTGPGVTLAFTRATEPDFFALRVDDTVVFDRLVPTDFFTSGTSYAFTWYGATPNESHTFEVEAVVSDAGVLKHSEGNSTVTTTPALTGIWFVDDSDAPYASGASVTLVRLDGQESQDFTIGESSNVYYPIGKRAPVTVTDSIRGAEGTISGSVTEDSNGYVDAFRWMKSPDQAGMTLRLIYGTTNIPVELGAAHLTPEPYTTEKTFAVSVDVVQVGEFD